jgi:hypothetical protein
VQQAGVSLYEVIPFRGFPKKSPWQTVISNGIILIKTENLENT